MSLVRSCSCPVLSPPHLPGMLAVSLTAIKVMVMQGSKLGSGFKWSTIKNTIDYEQETAPHKTFKRAPNLSSAVRPGLNIKLLAGQ